MMLFTKKNVFLGLVAVLALSIPINVGILQQQQETRGRASASTSLAFTPTTSTTAPIQKKMGETISLDLIVTPSNNLVTFVKFELKYDPTKLEPVGTDPFTLNTSAFVSKDGPVITSGRLIASASVGSDPTKAIQKPTKVGTILFRAIGGTGSSPTTITFENLTQALSSATTDQASENVISTTSPAHILIANNIQACTSNKYKAEMTAGQEVPTNTSSASGTTTLSLLAESKADATTTVKNLQPGDVTGMFIYSPASASAKGAQRVTLYATGTFANPHTANDVFIPEDVLNDINSGNAYVGITTKQYANGEIRGKLTCVTGGGNEETNLNFELLLHGIGSAGDNPNPSGSSLSNKNPLHPQRNLQLEIYDVDNKLVTSVSGDLSLNYEVNGGIFKGSLSLGTNFQEGNYNLKVKSDRYLKRRVPGIIQIKPKSDTRVPKIDLVAGDINSDNTLNVLDYNALLDCGYGEIEPLPMADPNAIFNKTECQAHTPAELIDLDDNGIINGPDYNLFIRELSVQNGD